MFRNRCGKASGIYYTVIAAIDLLEIYSKLIFRRSFLHLTIYILKASLSAPVRRIRMAVSKSLALIFIPIDIKSENVLQEMEDKPILNALPQLSRRALHPAKPSMVCSAFSLDIMY